MCCLRVLGLEKLQQTEYKIICKGSKIGMWGRYKETVDDLGCGGRVDQIFITYYLQTYTDFANGIFAGYLTKWGRFKTMNA